MEWKKVNICDMCDSISATYSRGADMVVLINTSDVLDGKFLNRERVPNKDLKGQFKKTFQRDDILYSEIRPANKRFAYVDFDAFDYIASTKLMVLRAKPNVNPRFLYHILKSESILEQLQVLAESRSGTFPQITYSEMANVSVLLPDRETQRRIAAILSSLDDKTENNNRINRNLEAQAQALFKSWFVDFEPFGGKMPEDWKFDDISNIPHVLETGRRPKGGAVESGVPSIGAEHIKGMGTYDFSKTKYITEDYARSMKSGKINGYELLIYKDGGKPGYFIPNFTIYGEGYPFEECYINEHVLKLDFPSKAYNIFCYFYFQTPEVMNYLNAQGGKAAIPGINKSDIDNINILTPDNNTVVQFGEIVLPYFTSILQNLAENKRLAALRDTLLPKLMKGEIEV